MNVQFMYLPTLDTERSLRKQAWPCSMRSSAPWFMVEPTKMSFRLRLFMQEDRRDLELDRFGSIRTFVYDPPAAEGEPAEPMYHIVACSLLKTHMHTTKQNPKLLQEI